MITIYRYEPDPTRSKVDQLLDTIICRYMVKHERSGIPDFRFAFTLWGARRIGRRLAAPKPHKPHRLIEEWG